MKSGPFYDATCPSAKDSDGKPTNVTVGQKDPYKRTAKKDRLWSRHHWTLQDNTAAPHQWEEALIEKARNKWTDDHPVWRREYLGEWADGGDDGLVYRYSQVLAEGRGTWNPELTEENPTGLPEDGSPWRFVAGMDFGFLDPTAVVVAAYSSKLRQLRHVWDHSAGHMVVDDVADLLSEVMERWPIEKIFADAGNLGAMVVASLAAKGFPIERADKREKYDHIELVNSAFMRGEILIIPETTLAHQLLTDAWKLGASTVAEMARAGKLVEDKSIPNDSVDAFLYMYRGSLHQFGGSTIPEGPAEGTEEWETARRREELRKARASLKASPEARLGTNSFNKAPTFVQRALVIGDRWNPSQRPTFRRS